MSISHIRNSSSSSRDARTTRSAPACARRAGIVARGFFNDFDADGARDSQPHETIQFLVAEGDYHADSGIAAARYVVQVSGKYRPRLLEVEQELRRRVGDAAEVLSLDGAERALRATRARSCSTSRTAGPCPAVPAASRATPSSCRSARPAQWWDKPSLDRHTYFYPHVDADSGCPVARSRRAAQDGIPTVYRRLYHNPDGYQRRGEFDFVTYFECEDRHLETFERVHRRCETPPGIPSGDIVREGPLWRGRRVLRW